MHIKVSEAITDKCAKLEYRFSEDSEIWDTITRAESNAADRIMNGYENIMYVVRIIIEVVSVLTIIIVAVWWVGLSILGICIPLFYFASWLGKKQYGQERTTAEQERRASYFIDLLNNRELAEERTLFGYTDHINKRWHGEYIETQRIRFRVRRRSYIGVKSSTAVLLFISVAVIGILLYPLQSGALTVGLFCALVTSLINLVKSLGWQASWSITEISTIREYLKDLSALFGLSEKEDALSKRANLADYKYEKLEFRNLSFAYPGTERKVLENFNFTMRSGLTYAIVGVNGAGKTSLVKILCGMFDNYEGEIYINDKELRTYSSEFIKGFFGIVFQDFARYSIPLKDNITFGCTDKPDDSAIWEILDSLDMGEWARALPEGLDTPLGKILENSTELSGGQWQRITLARCLLATACVRILDEPTAALDPIAESKLYALFSAITKGFSSILITHRLGAAKLADEILVLEGGCVQEHGTHDELMAKNGLYSQMYESQKEWYDETKK